MVDCRPLDDDEKSSMVDGPRATKVVVERRSTMDDQPIDDYDGFEIVGDR